MRRAALALGVLLTLIGLLWIGQGLGYIAWPGTSFMIGERVWADYGSALAVAGLLIVIAARRWR
jgi:hypothetical protein